MPRIIPNLWFDSEAFEAAEFYCSVFPNSEITRVSHYTEAGSGEPGTVLTVDVTLDGQPYTAINGGPQFPFTEAVSLLVECADQAEVDRYWIALADGGEEVQCGWLKDRYGLSWQICPSELGEILGDPDPARADPAIQAMFGMVRIYCCFRDHGSRGFGRVPVSESASRELVGDLRLLRAGGDRTDGFTEH